MTIYFIRHGETVANVKRIWGMDYPLTEKGIMQAETVDPPDVSLILTSDLIRAKQTAEAIFPGRDYVSDHSFREIGFGVMEDTPMIVGSRELTAYEEQPENLHLVIEGAENITERAVTALNDLVSYSEKETEGDMALVTHKSLMRAMLSIVDVQNLDKFMVYDISNCAVIPVSVSDIKKALDLYYEMNGEEKHAEG